MTLSPLQRAEAAAERLAAGRVEVDAPGIDRMPDDLLKQALWLVSHTDGLPQGHFGAEFDDLWQLLDAIEDTVIQIRPRAMRKAAADGRSYASMGPTTGANSRQAVRGQLIRYEAAAAGGPKDERWARQQHKEEKKARNRKVEHAYDVWRVASAFINAFERGAVDPPPHWPDVDDLDELLPQPRTMTPAASWEPSDALVGYVRVLVRDALQRPAGGELRVIAEEGAHLLS